MAKRHYVRRAATAVRRVYRRARVGVRRYGKRSVAATMTFLTIGASFAYGWGRGWLTNNSLVQSALSWLPFGGQYKDNILLGGAAMLISWLLKPTNAYVKLALRTIVHSEAFIMGAKMQSGATLMDSSTQSSSYGGVLLN